MKTGRSPDSKTVKTSKKCNRRMGSIGVKTSSKRTNMSIYKTHGCGENLLDEKEVQYSFKEAVGKGLELSGEGTFLAEERTPELDREEKNISSGKMKLQLFPINKGTQIGLEKGGHNPYLELTLGSQKKISSVLKHLKKKWGCSTIAIGEPMLFPYYIKENLSNCRGWTLDDNEITAAAVHAAIGGPATFRLRYGWFTTHEGRSLDELSTEAGLQYEGTQGGCITNSKTLYDKRDKVEVTSKEYKAIDMGDATNAVMAQRVDNVSVVPQDNEPISSGLERPSLLWVDSLSNISIGGLLSEASLQGNASMHPSQILSDSLDAFIASQNSHPQVSRQSTADLRPSILDAEETCHAFPLQKFTSPGIHVQTASGMICSDASSLDVSKSFKLPNAERVNDQDGLPQDPASGKNETDLLFLSRTYDEERSLGLTGINWYDSLGPFDLGMPAQKLTGGDSVSIGGFVR